MQFTFPITIYNWSDLPKLISDQEIGRIGDLDVLLWSLRPIWRSKQQLSAVDIFRSDKYGRVDIELHLRSRNKDDEDWYEYNNDSNQRPYKIFKATLLHDERVHRISTNLSLETRIEGRPDIGFEGHVVIYSSPPCICKADDRNAVSSSSKLSSDFLRLLDYPTSFPDATLKCGTTEIPVHKNILSVRSPVLAAMFSNERSTLKRKRTSEPLKEDLSSTVHITDIKPEVLQVALRYIYGGKTDGLTDVLAGDLLFAADKYQLEELKSVCVAKLRSSVTVDNVFHILVLGEMHDKGLKTYAMDFLCGCDRYSKLEETKEFVSLEEKYPRLAVELLKSVVRSLRQKK